MEKLILTECNFNRLKDAVKKNEDKFLIFTSGDDELNRKVLEKLSVNLLLIPLETRKDFSKQRNAGFNEVLAKIAGKNKIEIGIDLDEVLNSKEKDKILARIKQSVKLCNKNKVQMQFVQNKDKRNLDSLKSLGLVLGMPTWMTKKLKEI